MRQASRKLGKLAPKRDHRIKCLSRYLKTACLPPPLPSVNWVDGLTDFGMMLNDQQGDCTIAGPGHLIEVHTFKESGQEIVVPDSAIQQAYIDVTQMEGAAFDPTTGANDNGCALTDVLNYWMNTGIGGHKIIGYVSLDPTDHDHVKIAMRLFGGLDVGVALPNTAQSQVGQIWDVVPDDAAGNSQPGSWGGHCIAMAAYAGDDSLTSITWGALQNMTYPWWDMYCDEAYAVITADWVANNGDNPEHFNLALLQQDMQALKS